MGCSNQARHPKHMTEHRIDPLAAYLSLVQSAQPACRVQRTDSASVRISSAQADSVMEVEIMVHQATRGGYGAWRYQPGRALAPHERAHAWVTLREPRAGGALIHHEVLCDPARFSALLQGWLLPQAAAPLTLTLPAQPAQPASMRTGPAHAARVDTEAALTLDVDAALLARLPDTAAAAAAATQLNADVASLQLSRVVQHWPRDVRGRLAARTSVLLAAYGPATRKRQPCLLISSAMPSKMPAWRLHLAQEFLYNPRHQWRSARWLWSADGAPPANKAQAQACALLGQGQISEACALYGVQLGERLRRLAAGQAFQRFEPVPADWGQELRDALYRLAPWRLLPGLQQIQAHLGAANQTPPKAGSWERKLFWFSGQRQQVRWGPGVRFAADGTPELDLLATASNEYFPQPDWFRY